MLTLSQMIHFDAAAIIYKPIIESQWNTLWFFVSFFVFVSIALMNLVTAIIVEGCFAQTREDQELNQMYRDELMKKFP